MMKAELSSQKLLTLKPRTPPETLTKALPLTSNSVRTKELGTEQWRGSLCVALSISQPYFSTGPRRKHFS